MSIRPDQIKAARILLGWSEAKLASRVGLTGATIIYFEYGVLAGGHLALVRIQNVLRGAGVEFIAEFRGPGVRLRKGR